MYGQTVYDKLGNKHKNQNVSNIDQNYGQPLGYWQGKLVSWLSPNTWQEV